MPGRDERHRLRAAPLSGAHYERDATVTHSVAENLCRRQSDARQNRVRRHGAARAAYSLSGLVRWSKLWSTVQSQGERSWARSKLDRWLSRQA